MDLIACSYKNIGPFYDKLITVFFQGGKYLIKAPIGSGKSFLFFDAPVFALYKQSHRPLLSRQAKQGFIHLLFEHDGYYRCIERQIKPSKSGGDSVVSRLYQVDKKALNVLSGGSEIIQYDIDIKEQITPFLEEISFNNQTELNKNLADLLPPKEVLLSVNFLLQDADNIFEMTPHERVNVFKHLFGLIGIDHAKEKIRERRKEVQTIIKVKGDFSHIEGKFHSLIQEIFESKKKIEHEASSGNVFISKIQQAFASDFFRDLILVKENLQIEHFQVDVDKSIWKTIQGDIAGSLSQIHAFRGKREELQQQKTNLEKELKILQEEKKEKALKYEDLQKKIASGEESGLQVLKETYKKLQQQQEALEQNISPEIWDIVGKEECSFAGAVRFIDSLLAEGKQRKTEQEKIDLQIKNIIKQQKEKEKRKGELGKQLKILNQKYEEQKQFHCSKIDGNCPYVEVIKGASMKMIQEQKTQVEKQLDDLKHEFDDITPLTKLENQQQACAEKITNIRQMLQDISWKKIQEYYQQRSAFDKKMKSIGEEITKKENHQSTIDTWKQQLALLSGEITTLEKQEKQKKEQISSLEKTLQEYQEKQKSGNEAGLRRLEAYITDFLYTLDQLSELTKEYKQIQQDILILKEEEKRLKDLYTIFSQELLLVVLQDFLPTLEEVMNTYLAQIVDYEVRFHLPLEAGEKIELHIHIVDEKGERHVKSLSGGQRAVLRIARVLSVSIIMKGSFLFLDETITSMDAGTIGKVADVLEEFVKQQGMKFYVVTHSPQIQDMAIWDQTVKVGIV